MKLTNNKTVAMILIENGEKDINQDWQHDQSLQNDSGDTVAHILAKKGKLLTEENKYWYECNGISTLKNNENWTIAMLLAKNGEGIPQQLQHDKYLRNDNNDTVKTLLKQNTIPVPKEWDYNDQLLDEYYKDCDVFTKNLIAPGDSINIYMMTYAMYLSSNKIQPLDKWKHHPDKRDIYGRTTEYYLKINNLQVKDIWKEKYVIQELINQLNNGAQIEKESDIDANYQNKDGLTIAMVYAKLNKEIPQCWYHKKLLTNNNEQTVAIIQSSKGIIPDEYWMHDIDIKDKYGNSIRSNLQEHGYICVQDQKSEKYIIYKQEIQGYMCCICKRIKNQFVIIASPHNHQEKVCKDCFEEYLAQGKCAVCKKPY